MHLSVRLVISFVLGCVLCWIQFDDHGQERRTRCDAAQSHFSRVAASGVVAMWSHDANGKWRVAVTIVANWVVIFHMLATKQHAPADPPPPPLPHARSQPPTRCAVVGAARVNCISRVQTAPAA